MNPKSKVPCNILMELESMARCSGRFLSHQSDWGLPPTFFPFWCHRWYQIVGSWVPRSSACVIDYVSYGRVMLVVPKKDITVGTASMDSFLWLSIVSGPTHWELPNPILPSRSRQTNLSTTSYHPTSSQGQCHIHPQQRRRSNKWIFWHHSIHRSLLDHSTRRPFPTTCYPIPTSYNTS